MVAYVLALKPAIGLYGQHDPSAVLFRDGEAVFGIEEERLSRNKHAVGEFPERAIEACLDYEGIDLADVEEIRLPYRPELRSRILGHYLRDAVSVGGLAAKANAIESVVRSQIVSQFFSTRDVERRLAAIGEPVPPIRTMEHHACHAASAFHPSGFDDALVLTIDAKGEYDSTVVWDGTSEGVERVRTYEHPNSLGLFYAIVTEYLGYRMFNGEGKVMGLAPYGERDPEIESALREVVETGVEYDVTPLTKRWGTDHGVSLLEELFDRPRTETAGEFDQWERNLAHTTQALLEETVLSIVETYCRRLDRSAVALAGGVALNCKMNQRIRDSAAVDGIFVQPAAHDAGLALGAGYLDQRPADVPEMTTAYLGPSYDTDEVVDLFSMNKIAYDAPEDVEGYVAERLAEGALVGWFQGRMEIGPRALGNRSILADPRTVESRDRVNEFVKHREGWRPFAPSILEEAASEYLVGGEPAPFMVQTFEVKPAKKHEIEAVLHPADDTTRPQTVRPEQNPRYHRLISEFEAVTGVPALLNTSFNDHAEPIVTRPTEAIKDFFGMGLDVLVLGEIVVEKATQRSDRQGVGERVAGRSLER
ncbi:carbamoyltransferase family protein [Natronorarus salvus]|uniref:carbamoyltransferase family protein n=1 Tax=Natronorarus salvus TaxID=3117733 RepID=UPI002F269F5D